MYATDADWEADFARAQEFPARIATYKGKISQTAAGLLEFLQLNDELTELLDRLANYAHRRLDENTRNSTYQSLSGRLSPLFVELGSASAFEVPEILSISDGTLEGFYRELPALEQYRIALAEIRRRKAHSLPEEQEKLLALSGDALSAPEEIYSMFSDADLEFPEITGEDGKPVKVTHASYMSLMQCADRRVRKAAFDAMYQTFGKFKNTAAAMLAGQVKGLVFAAKARNYSGTLEAALDRTNIPTEVYRNLITAVRGKISAMHRYAGLRKKALGLDELHMYDLYTPMVPKAEMKIPFEQAKEMVYDALKPMGEEYRAILREGFDNGWIDVYENAGKRSGAYSAGAKIHPYVLLNYHGTIDSLFTLAHEMGHAIHSYLSNKNQPVVYSDYVIFVAEVASTCNEALLMEHLLKITEDRQQRAYLINYFLEQFRGTMYRQTMFAEFELAVNEMTERGEVLTAEALCERYRELNAFYYGADVVIDDEIQIEWARIPHFYYDYYVYQYATGYAAAIALSQRILKGGAPAVKDYLGFLSAGRSADPITILKGAGVDMSTAEPITAALERFDGLITEMESLLG